MSQGESWSLTLVPLTNHFLAAMVRATQQSVVCVIYSRYGNGEQAPREGGDEVHMCKSLKSSARRVGARVEGGIMQHYKCRFVRWPS